MNLTQLNNTTRGLYKIFFNTGSDYRYHITIYEILNNIARELTIIYHDKEYTAYDHKLTCKYIGISGYGHLYTMSADGGHSIKDVKFI